jgi:hypothetical protein
MSTSPHESNTIDHHLLDRLVDGELDGPERANLLRRLEDHPDGWRCCALAFLEAQTWRQALGAERAWSAPHTTLASSPGGPATDRETAVARAVSRSGRPGLRLVGTIAAAVAVAFLSGWTLGTSGRRATETHARDLPIPKLVRQIVEDHVPTARDLGADERTQAEALDRNGGALESSWPPERADPLPAPIVRQLARQGYKVEQRSTVVSMDARDGRRVDVPVDELRFQYVGGEIY